MPSASVRQFIVWLQQARRQGKSGTGAGSNVVYAPTDVTLTVSYDEDTNLDVDV